MNQIVHIPTHCVSRYQTMRQSAEYYNEELKTRFILDKMCEKDSNGDPAKDSAGEYIILANSKNRYNMVCSIFHKLALFVQKNDKDFN